MIPSVTLISSTAATVAARRIGGVWLPSMRVSGTDPNGCRNGGSACPTTTTASSASTT